MNLPQPDVTRQRLILSAILVTALLVVGWFVYQPALGGTFLLDDQPNLNGLTVVDDAQSARDFALSGRAGPLGRPIALASFAAQADSWESGAEAFLRINILIHLLNGLLLYLFIRQLARELRIDKGSIEFVALVTAALWLLMPLLASSTLMVVQRMTTLSATFVLAGLNAYLLSRRHAELNPNAALVGMSAALIVATLLAVLTKESGALLPVLVLVLEATLLAPPPKLPSFRWRAWSAVFLLAPTLLIVAFLISQAWYSENMVLRRDFTAWERLLTESRILWEYLVNAFIARPGQYGPFHDAYPVSRSLLEPATLVAAVSWLLLILGALIWRRRHPVAAFAVLWFVAGHLLESTTLPLELYFEHRNYMPIIGPVFALAYAVSRIAGTYMNYARGAMLLYLLVNTGILFGITSLWGSPLQAATYWHVQQPGSVRSASNLADRQLKEMGPAVAMVTLQEFASRYPEHAYVRIPELRLICINWPDRDSATAVDHLEAQLPSAAFSYTSLNMLDKLLVAITQEDCTNVSADDVVILADALLSNPRYAGNARYRQMHHMLMARMADMAGETDVALEHLSQAADYGPNDDVYMMLATTLIAAQRFDEAREYIRSALAELPLQPLRRYNSRKLLEQLNDYANELEHLAQSGGTPRTDDRTENDENDSSR
jgi:hypothetical protein